MSSFPVFYCGFSATTFRLYRMTKFAAGFSGGSGMSVGLGLKQLKVNLNSISAGGVTSVLDLGSSFFAPALERAVGHRSRIFNAISILTCPGGYPAEYMPKKFYKWGAVQECGSFPKLIGRFPLCTGKGRPALKPQLFQGTFGEIPSGPVRMKN